MNFVTYNQVRADILPRHGAVMRLLELVPALLLAHAEGFEGVLPLLHLALKHLARAALLAAHAEGALKLGNLAAQVRLESLRLEWHGLALVVGHEDDLRVARHGAGEELSTTLAVERAVCGSEEERRRAFFAAYSQLNRRISLFANLPLSKLAGLALQNELDAIGRLREPDE